MLRKTIDQSHERFLLAMKAGDGTSFEALLAGDVVFHPPHEHTRSGRRDVMAWVQGAFNQVRTERLDVSDREVVVAGDWAFESGSFLAVVTARDDGDTIEDQGRYLTIWQRQSDQTWKIARNIWNSSQPHRALNGASAD